MTDHYTHIPKITVTVDGGNITVDAQPVGAEFATATAVTVPADISTEIIPSALTNRDGIIVKNTSDTTTLWVGFLETEVDDGPDGQGYPLAPSEAIGIDIGPSVSFWGYADGGEVRVSILQGAS